MPNEMPCCWDLFRVEGDEDEGRAYPLLVQWHVQGLFLLLEQHGQTLALNDINLSIHENEFFVVMGLSGSGKSTLIRHLNGLIEANSSLP